VFPQSDWASEPMKLGLRLQDIPGAHGVAPVGQPWKIVEVDASITRPTREGGVNPAVFGKENWVEQLFEGTVTEDGTLSLSEEQQQALYHRVSRQPGSIWVISGLTAMPLTTASWSTSAKQKNDKRTLDSLNFAADGRAVDALREAYLGEVAKADGDVSSTRKLKPKIDL
jgi:type VI secretion system secreted protein VgrG